uniref:Reverse transcriptase domain-containing protein n=1 Tax=Tanacetum cinerariifolium TaxID=118510 RepID=A0A6L2L7H0_TANCI|nr:hypothetical protein [Tanacetum cinerariifolium]
MSSDNASSAVTYTSISSDSDRPSWGIPLMDARELSEMDLYEEVSQQGHAPPLSPSYVPDPMELDEYVPVYVSKPEHAKDHSMKEDSIDYPNKPEDDDEDPEKDLEEDHTDYAADGGDADDEPSDDDTNYKDKEPTKYEDDDEEEEDHLSLRDSSTVPVVDPVTSVGDTEAFETDESVPTPRSPQTWVSFSQTHPHRARKTIRLEPPMSASIEAHIDEHDVAPTPLTPGHHGARISVRPQTPMTASTQTLIDAFTVGSPLFPLPPTSLAYDQASLGHRTAMICMRDDILEEDMPPQRRFILTAPPHGFDVAKSSVAVARPPRGSQLKSQLPGTGSQAYLSPEAQNRVLLARLETLETHMSVIIIISICIDIMIISQNPFRHPKETLPILRMMKGKVRVEDSEGMCNLTLFHISGCTVDNQVKFATCTVLGTLKKKLTDECCLNSKIVKLEIELWYLKLDNIHGNVMFARPKTLDDAIELANDLMDQKLRTYAERQNDNKRKADDSSRNNLQQQPHKKQNVARAYTPGPGEKKAYTENLPLDCPVKMNNKKKKNKKAGACYECGNTEHIKKNYPKLKNHRNGNGDGVAHGRAYSLGGRDASPNSNIITGTFLLNNRYALILFDTGTDKSFVSTTFSALIEITPTTLANHYDIEFSIGKNYRSLHHNSRLHSKLHESSFQHRLDACPLGSFDVIIRMDWLTKYHGVIICDEKIVCVSFGREMLIFQGDGNNQKEESEINIISYTKAKKYLSKGCDVFLAHITTMEAKDKSKGKRLEDVPIVRDFPEVFPEDLPGIPPARQVEFQIYLVPGAAPVAWAPYRLAPSEMKELAEQLQELSN